MERKLVIEGEFSVEDMRDGTWEDIVEDVVEEMLEAVVEEMVEESVEDMVEEVVEETVAMGKKFVARLRLLIP